MYFAAVIAFMGILPIVSVAIDAVASPHVALVTLIGKWFVFWAVGMRLFTAGLRQLLRPEFTARTIFEIKDPAAFTVVTELGVSNLAIGVIALSSLAFPSWTMPAAAYGAMFYAVAAARHLRNPARNRHEMIATWSDLWAAIVLAGVVVGALTIRT